LGADLALGEMRTSQSGSGPLLADEMKFFRLED
jgi:hypothetical protein